MKAIVLLFVLLLFPLPDAAAESTPSCRVWLNGKALETVYETAVCHQRYWTAEPALSTTPVAIGSGFGPYRVEIQCLNQQVESALVRPLALGIQPEIADGKATQKIGQLEGYGTVKREYSFFGPMNMEKNPVSKKVTWLVRGEEGTEVTLEALSQKAGKASVSLRLTDNGKTEKEDSNK